MPNDDGEKITNGELARRIDGLGNALTTQFTHLEAKLDQYLLKEVFEEFKKSILGRMQTSENSARDWSQIIFTSAVSIIAAIAGSYLIIKKH